MTPMHMIKARYRHYVQHFKAWKAEILNLMPTYNLEPGLFFTGLLTVIGLYAHILTPEGFARIVGGLSQFFAGVCGVFLLALWVLKQYATRRGGRTTYY